MDQFIDVIRFPGKPGFRKQNRVIGMSSPENRVFQTNPTFFQGLVGQGVYIYISQLYIHMFLKMAPVNQ